MKTGEHAGTLPVLVAMLLGVVMLFAPTEKTMGQTHLRDRTLEDIAGRADLIVVAHPAKPFTTTRTVPVTAGTKNVPPFTTTVYHVEVIETLYYAFDGPVPKRLDVESADWEVQLQLHEAYYRDGESRHVVAEAYRSSLKDEELGNGPTILFLTYRSERAELVVAGAFESLKKRARVLKLIEQRKQAEGQ